MAVYSCHIGAFITSCHAWYTSVVGDEREHQLCSQLGSRVQFLQSLRASSSWATLGQWLRLSEPELSLCNRTHTSPYFTELLKEFPETIYKEWWTQRSKCPINICGESSQEQRHFFFFIHYRVLTQMHPSLVFDTVSLSFPNFYFICPLTCTPRYVRNDVIKALIIPQSMKIFLFLPISLRIIAKIFWGGVLACDLPCYFTSYHGSHPSFCLTHMTYQPFILALPPT